MENNFRQEPVVLQSFLNIFNVRQVTIGTNENDILFFNVPVKAEVDPDVPQKVTSILSTLAECSRFNIKEVSK